MYYYCYYYYYYYKGTHKPCLPARVFCSYL